MNSREKRMKDLKAVYLYNEKYEVLDKEDTDSIQREYLSHLAIRYDLKKKPEFTVNEVLNHTIKNIVTEIRKEGKKLKKTA